ncbi:hypothetical protein PVAP13_1KG255090 [Panicum virgatum]|uniref:Uncharacterized protein n=1 Tax=Panicum virgatum TaxID=38727 RepID=A0A8T0XHX8_PANVG|nr:hypothetical protein PVAP13_1KG255090 [Panicum virgatum]
MRETRAISCIDRGIGVVDFILRHHNSFLLITGLGSSPPPPPSSCGDSGSRCGRGCWQRRETASAAGACAPRVPSSAAPCLRGEEVLNRDRTARDRNKADLRCRWPRPSMKM